MLESVRGLSPDAARAVAELERRTVAHDGGRLKLEWGTLNAGRGEQMLWWDGDTLLGFLGRYSIGSNVELAGMVDPRARRRGIATALLDAALAIGSARFLLVVPRASEAGAQLAGRRGAALDHSEHALALTTEPTDGPADPQITLRGAVAADLPDVRRLLEVGFGWTPPDELQPGTRLAERDGRPVGVLHLRRTADTVGVYGFVVDPDVQGQGIGRDVLRRVCRQARAEGATRIALEVEVGNERALGLYTSIGFTPVTTEDYYVLPDADG